MIIYIFKKNLCNENFAFHVQNCAWKNGSQIDPIFQFIPFYTAVVNILGDSKESQSEQSTVSMNDMSPVTLFQSVSKSSAITSPIMKVEPDDNHTLFVHYMEQTHRMLFHWLNVLPNTTNTEFIQHGYRDIHFGTNIHCETFNFTRVSFEECNCERDTHIIFVSSYRI